MKTVLFRTFGCKQNQYDTDFLKQLFKEKGYQVTDSGPADVVVVNTCAVTARSAAKCRQAIRAAARSGSLVVVTGCYPQLSPQEVADIPGVLVVTGVRDRRSVIDALERALACGQQVISVKPHDPGEEFEETRVANPSLTRAYVKIQEGCDDYCTYCVVPFVRGPSRSRPIESILEEVRQLVERGYKEMVLTGTHIGLYGKDRPQGGNSDGTLSLSDVVRRVCDVKGVVRVRLSSLEPHDVTDDLIDCLRLPQVCHHLHLPLQSGSDSILKAMGRRYQSSAFLRTVEKIREVAPDCGITTDIIVGFPGESDEDFQKTLDLVRRVRFSRLHVFKYSPRPFTRASAYENRVPERVKEERSDALISLGRELSLDFHRIHVGKQVEVLVEDERSGEGMLTGLTGNFIRCWFQGPDDLKGEIVRVMGVKATAGGLQCEGPAGKDPGGDNLIHDRVN